MSAEPALAAAAASEAKHTGVHSPRSSSLSPPSDPSEQPAASDGPMVQRSTASREVPLSQSGGWTGSSTSKGATMPATRACSAKKLDTSTGEMPEATLQVCANSMAVRGGCFLAPVFSSPPSLPRLSLSLACPRPPYSLCAMAPGRNVPHPSAPSLRPALRQDVMQGLWARTDAFQQDQKVHARHLHLHTLPAPFLHTLVCTRLHPSASVCEPCAPWHPMRSFVAVLANLNPNPNPDPNPDPKPGPH